MYIYHALIDTLNAHLIHINLNTLFYTDLEDSPIKTIDIRCYMHTHTHTHTRVHARTHNDQQKLGIDIGVEILWEEEGF